MKGVNRLTRILALKGAEISQVLTFEKTIEKVEEGFVALFEGGVQAPPIQRMENAAIHGELDIKSAFSYRPGPYAAIKTITVYPTNPANGLPPYYAVILLVDGGAGAPIALMDADLITNWRTGAAAAIASKYMSKADADTVGLVGGGIIAEMALRALCLVRPVKRARVWSPSAERSEGFARRVGDLGLQISAVNSPSDAVRGAPIVVTATPSRKPVVSKQMVGAGTHINAMGSDGPGKQELEADLVASSRLVVDSLDQCRMAGELQHCLKAGLMSEGDVHAEIGAVISGARPGRVSQEEITVFDSTGVGIQDLAVASLVYEAAKEKGLGTWVNL